MDLPDKRQFSIYLILPTIILFLVVCVIFAEKTTETSSQNAITLNECFTRQVNMPYYPHIQILGMEVDEELYTVLKCENPTFDPTLCNQKYGCGSGIGPGQLTAIAIKDCEKGLGKIIDPYDKRDNLECSIWLYEKYGTAPWGCPDCEWGSYNCWSKP